MRYVFSLQRTGQQLETVLTRYNIYCIFAAVLTMLYPIMPVGVVAGKAMIDGG